MATPNEGRAAAGRLIYDNGNSLVLRLFSNDVTLDNNTVLADLTEVTGNGYAAVPIGNADWTVNADGTVSAPAQDFVASGGAWTVYGWYLTIQDESAVERLLHVRRDANAPVTVNDGSTYRVTPDGAVTGT